MPKSRKKKKVRNWHALNAILGRKVGPHPDKKKEDSKKACRSLRQKIVDWVSS